LKRGRRQGRPPFRRRRLVLLLCLIAVIALAIAVPLTCRGSGSDQSESEGRSTTTGRVSSAGSSSPSTSVAPDGRPVTPARARAMQANEMGLVPVLMYHAIKPGIVSPQRLREDVALLKEAGFYPTTIREMAEGRMDIPAGKSPVVLTFDDSSPGQYRILDDGSLDPDCAVGILEAAVAGGGWASKASFFPLLYVDPPSGIVFGQPAYAETKLRNLVKWGYEVGSHTVTHQDLSAATPAQIRKELAESESRLEAMIGGGYQIYTLNPPYGEYPEDESLLAEGKYGNTTYQYSAALMAWGESGPSPFSDKFDPMHIPRITAYPKNTVRDLVEYFRSQPGLRFVSDGDPNAISVPETLSTRLGALRTDLEQKIVRY
jgi:peptidoglycan/xylan/chitin deacetylase (PgdA/CDA1 family)